MNENTLQEDKILVEIKNEVIKTMLLRVREDKLTNDEIKKVIKFINIKMSNNTSKNRIDNRINSLFNSIKKLFEEYSKYNDVYN